MKLLFIALIALLSTESFARPFVGTGFSAPNVNGTNNVGNPQVGDIVFDTSAGGFWGYGGVVPGWISFGSGGSTAPAPTIQTFTSGTGAYTTPVGVKYIRVRMVGGGEGGSGSGVASGGNGVAGGATTFGSSLLIANGGGSVTFGIGGTATIGAGASGSAFSGGDMTLSYANANASYMYGTAGVSSPFGGGGAGTRSGGVAAKANTGSGGGGAGFSNLASGTTGGGGSAGGFIDAIIGSPAATYSYTVGTGGSGGSAGTSGAAGGAGAAGYIEVTEYYQ